MAQNQTGLKTFTFSDMDKTKISTDETAEQLKKRMDKRLGELAAIVEENNQQIQTKVAKLSTADEKTKTELMKEIADLKKQNVIIGKVSKDEQEKFNTNPELFTQLSNIKNRLDSRYNENGKDVNMLISMTPDKELMLVVEKMTPSHFSFALRDGKVTFSDYDVNVAQAKELLNMLAELGIKNIALPDGMEEKLKGTLEQARAEIAQEENNEYSPLTGENDYPREENILHGELKHDEVGTTKVMAQANAPKYKLTYGEVKERIENILTDGLNKKRGLSYFPVSKGGWDAWYLYDNESPDNYDTDGKFNNKGNLEKVKHSVIYWTRPRDDGGVDFAFSLPGNKKIDDDTADRLIGLNKSMGCTHIEFSGLKDGDKGVLRNFCAAHGVVPIGIGINASQAMQMVEKAKSLPESQQQMFKWRLAQQLRENAQKAGNMADMADTIGALEAEYNYTPFKKAYEGSLKKLMEQEIKKASAENIIGAGRTIAKLFEAYRGGAEDNPQVSLGKVLSPERGIFTAEEIELIKGKFAAMGLGLNMESTMRELPPEYMTYMYQALQPHEAKLAGEELKETLNSPDMNTKERKDSIKEAVGGAFELVRNVTGDMEAKGIRGLRAPNRGSITPTLSAQYLPDIMKQPRQPRPSNNYERGGRE